MKTSELCQRLNITHRMLQWWREHRLIRPHRLPRSGFCEFDEAECLLVAIMGELRHKGLSLHQIRKLKLKPDKIAGDYLVTDRRQAVYCTEAELLLVVEASPRGCYVISLNDLRARLSAPPKTRKASA